MTVVEQSEVSVPLLVSVQGVPLKVALGLAVKATEPPGEPTGALPPLPPWSVTVALHVSVELTGGLLGEQLTAVEVVSGGAAHALGAKARQSAAIAPMAAPARVILTRALTPQAS